MCIIFVSFILCTSQVIYCEWIEIFQPFPRSSGITNNHSVADVRNFNVPNNFDYSTYKDFFSIIEPDIDFANPIDSFNTTVVNKFTNENKLLTKGMHIIRDRPENNIANLKNKIEVLLNTPEKSIFSRIGGTRDKFVINPANIDSMLISTEKNYSNEKLNFSLESENVKIEMTEKTTNIKPIRKSDERPNNRDTINKRRVILKRIDYKPFDFNGILRFFTNIQQSFPLTTFASIREKVTFLNRFKNDLIENIEERFKLLWPVDVNQTKRRMRRSESSHAVDFPASGTALMTISFLTLAVFLIKLVLQVIHTIKSKHVGYQTMMTPAAAQNETPIKIIKAKRNARKLSLSTTDDLRAVTDAITSIEKNFNSMK